MTEMKKHTTITKREIFLINEGVIRSIIADTVTFGSMLGIALANHYLLDGRWYFDAVAIFAFWVTMSGKSNKLVKRFHSKQKFKEYVNRHY